MKFGNKWTGVFGSKGVNKTLTWTSAEVNGGRAQLYGLTYDSQGQADFLSFHMCEGGIGATGFGGQATAMTQIKGT
jgi:hypothetical protein